MTDWIILSIYVLGFLVGYRPAYRVLDDSMRGIGVSTDAADRGIQAMLAMCISGMWPAVIPGLVIWKTLTPTTDGDRADALAERERQVREREANIRRLEREAGLQ